MSSLHLAHVFHRTATIPLGGIFPRPPAALPEADRKRIGTAGIWLRKRPPWSDRSMHEAHRPTRGACRIRRF
ncbi:hypothetical protein EZV63_20455 [Streptomyces sp. VN1]|nr:hypothetical protein EZV63_20455 [Streptomyces sp. VN1]